MACDTRPGAARLPAGPGGPADFARLASVAAAGFHDPSWQPLTEWTDVADLEWARGVVQHVWRNRAALSPEHWFLSFAVLRDGVVVGRQDLEASRFAVTREVSTGSWLGLAHQGLGTGTAMRLAVLSLASDHLGASTATTGAYKDDEASTRVRPRPATGRTARASRSSAVSAGRHGATG